MKIVRWIPFLIVGLVVSGASVIVGCTQNEHSVTQAAQEGENNNSKFIYFTTSPSPVLTEAEVERTNLTVVKSFEELQRVVNASSSLEILLIDPDDVTSFHGSWLRAVYEQGIVVAALDTSISTLAPKIDLIPKVDDLRPKREPSDIGVTAVYMASVGETGRTMRQHSELYPDFESMFTILKTFADLDPYSRPPAELLPGTASPSDKN